MTKEKEKFTPLAWIVYNHKKQDIEIGGDMEAIKSLYVEGHEIDFTRHITQMLDHYIHDYLVDLIKKQKKVKKK